MGLDNRYQNYYLFSAYKKISIALFHAKCTFPAQRVEAHSRILNQIEVLLLMKIGSCVHTVKVLYLISEI